MSKKKFKEAVLDSGGVITTIANRLNVQRKTVYEWLVKHPEMKEYIEQETEKILDMAEISLFSQVKDKDLGATKYLLSTKGKNRGYIEKQEKELSFDNKGEKPIFQFITENVSDKNITKTDGSNEDTSG